MSRGTRISTTVKHLIIDEALKNRDEPRRATALKVTQLLEDIGEAVGEFKAGKIEFRNDAGGNIHVPVGKLSFSTEALAENVRALLSQLLTMKPTAAKGRYLKKAHVASTMSPALRIDLSETHALRS